MALVNTLQQFGALISPVMNSINGIHPVNASEKLIQHLLIEQLFRTVGAQLKNYAAVSTEEMGAAAHVNVTTLPESCYFSTHAPDVSPGSTPGGRNIIIG